MPGWRALSRVTCDQAFFFFRPSEYKGGREGMIAGYVNGNFAARCSLNCTAEIQKKVQGNFKNGG